MYKEGTVPGEDKPWVSIGAKDALTLIWAWCFRYQRTDYKNRNGDTVMTSMRPRGFWSKIKALLFGIRDREVG